jgi:hypothetical protein
MPKWDKRGWWPHGMTNTVKARNAVPYLLKYLSKGTTFGNFPKGARIYGIGGLEQSLRRSRSWLNRPTFVQGNASIDDQWRRAQGGGWLDHNGTFWRSEFRATAVGPHRAAIRVHTHPRSIDVSGPFSWVH